MFYNIHRPLLSGFFPDGISLLGTDGIVRPSDWISCPKGPSAGQSTMFLLLDIFLGIDHGSTPRQFQEEMLGYMPRQHKEMVIRFKEANRGISLRNYIKGNVNGITKYRFNMHTTRYKVNAMS